MNITRRTQQAFRQAVYARLTAPPMTYQINDAPVQTLPIANVVPRAVWIPGRGGTPPPMPLVAYSVSTRDNPPRQAEDRGLWMKIWCVSSSGPDECSEIYEAVRALVHTADQQGPAPDLSRASTASTLGLVVRKCTEERVSDVDFEEKTQRWYLVAEYRVVAL